MIKVIKKPKYSVVCKGCGSTLTFEPEDVTHRADRHCNLPAMEGGDEPSIIDRFFITCPVCDSHPNVAGIVSKKIKILNI